MLLGLILAGLTPVWVRPRCTRLPAFPSASRRRPWPMRSRPLPTPGGARVRPPPTWSGRRRRRAGPRRAHAWGPAGRGRRVGRALRLPPRPSPATPCSSARWWSAPTRRFHRGARRRWLLARTERIDPARLDAAVEATQTTSPAGAVLASIDAARALLDRDAELLGAATGAVAAVRDRLREVDGLVVLDGPDVDPLKLTLVLGGTGADGIEVEDDLLGRLPVEAAERDLTWRRRPWPTTRSRSAGSPTRWWGRSRGTRGPPRAGADRCGIRRGTGDRHLARDMFFAPSERLKAGRAVGRVTVELVAPYPPGIPDPWRPVRRSRTRRSTLCGRAGPCGGECGSRTRRIPPSRPCEWSGSGCHRRPALSRR